MEDSSATSSVNNKANANRCRDLFVGNLSFFCQEKHLKELFVPFGEVHSIRIKRNDKGGRSLMYGFVSMASPVAAYNAAHSLHEKLFMGRNVRVELSSGPEQVRSNHSTNFSEMFQLHLCISSNFDTGKIIYPTEELLRSIFEKFGDLVDITVKEYIIHRQRSRQEGYGFVTYSTEIAASQAAANCAVVEVQGVRIESCLSFHNPKPRSNPDSAESSINTSPVSSVSASPALEPSMYYHQNAGQTQSQHHTPATVIMPGMQQQQQASRVPSPPSMKYSPPTLVPIYQPAMAPGGQMPMNCYQMPTTMMHSNATAIPYFPGVDSNGVQMASINPSFQHSMNMNNAGPMIAPGAMLMDQNFQMYVPTPMQPAPQLMYEHAPVQQNATYGYAMMPPQPMLGQVGRYTSAPMPASREAMQTMHLLHMPAPPNYFSPEQPSNMNLPGQPSSHQPNHSNQQQHSHHRSVSYSNTTAYQQHTM